MADEPRHDEADQLSNTCAHIITNTANTSPNSANTSPYIMHRAMRRRFSMLQGHWFWNV
jgi:hypothetical protein